jgi:hypothetical protein
VARRGRLREPIDLSATGQDQAADARIVEQRSSARSAGSDEESLTLLEESEPNHAPQRGRETALGAVAWYGLVNRFLRPGN